MLFGPIADAANEKLASEMPDLFVIASESLPAFSVFLVKVFLPK